MAQHEINSELLATCRVEAAHLVAKYNWHLVTSEELARRGVSLILDDTATSPARAVLGAYSLALYAACAGTEGDGRREQGYSELFNYLFSLASIRYSDVAEDATQEAIARVYRGIGDCRHPIAFIAFAQQRLLDATRYVRRQISSPRERSLDEALSDAGETLNDYLADSGRDPFEEASQHELQRSVLQTMLATLHISPRASRQFRTLWFKYIEGQDDAEIGEQLGISIAQVHVLRSRARARLRRHSSWRRLADDCGLE